MSIPSITRLLIPGRRTAGAPRRAVHRAAVVLSAVLAFACSDGASGPSELQPTAGILTLMWTVPDTSGRSIVLTLSGPGVEHIAAAHPEYLVVARSGDGPLHRIAVFGTLVSGPLLRFAVPDTNRPDLYDIRVIEVGDEGDNVRAFPTDYSIRLSE